MGGAHHHVPRCIHNHPLPWALVFEQQLALPCHHILHRQPRLKADHDGRLQAVCPCDRICCAAAPPLTGFAVLQHQHLTGFAVLQHHCGQGLLSCITAICTRGPLAEHAARYTSNDAGCVDCLGMQGHRLSTKQQQAQHSGRAGQQPMAGRHQQLSTSSLAAHTDQEAAGA